MSIERKRIEADRAQRLEVNEDLQAVLDELRGEAVEAFTGSAPDDRETRESAYRDIRAIDRIRELIETKLATYQAAAHRAGRKNNGQA